MQHRGPTAARRAKKHDTLFGLYLQGQAVNGAAPIVGLTHRSEFDHAHADRSARVCQSATTKSGSSMAIIKTTHKAEIGLGAPLAIKVNVRTGRVSEPGG